MKVSAGRPLEGKLVLALEQAVAAPYCTSRLADAGARVIKIERKEGDFARRYDSVAKGDSSYFVWLNRGKESIVADIKQQADLELIKRILARADVFIQNLAPQAAARAGLDAASLRRNYPRLVTASISGYGESGAYSDRKAYDLLVQAETGLCSVTGTADEPGRVGVSVCDIATGLYTYTAILESLLERDRTGEGAAVSVSLFDSMAEWMTVPLLHEVYGLGAPPRVGLNHPSIAPYGAYPAGPDRVVLFSIQNEREWKRFAEGVLGDAALVSDCRFDSNNQRVRHRSTLDAIIESTFLSLSHEEVIARLTSADIAFGELNGPRELFSHPQLRLSEVDTSNGPVSIVAPPGLFNGVGRSLGPVPGIGQHGDQIRQEFCP